MKKVFGMRQDGQTAYLYTIRSGSMEAQISDHGATLVKLFVPDKNGVLADVVLGFDSPDEYTQSTTHFGAIVGRNTNRVGNARFTMDGQTYHLDANDRGVHSLHGGFDPFKNRLWQVVEHTDTAIKLRLDSPDGDQGYPGNAVIHVTYSLEADGVLCIAYDAVCDRDTVFNMTNHSFFNLAGHNRPTLAMEQLLCICGSHFNPEDAMSIPTGALQSVAGTPMDFRTPKAIGRDICEDYDALKLQGGYDHNWALDGDVCAVLRDPCSGRCMTITTDCPGVQFYSGNYLSGDRGKDGVSYCYRGGVALETQFFPDAVNHPQWKQPFFKAGQPYHSETRYRFE